MEKSTAHSTSVENIEKHHPKRILFANAPADGHFNPLTSLALYLKEAGYEVRWYSSVTYSKKLTALGIHHYPFVKAKDVIDNDFDAAFPGREKIKSQLKKLIFDMVNAFVLRSPEYYQDLLDIHQTYPFDMVICDCVFTAIPFITGKMNIPVISIGVLPLTETSKDLAPAGFGLTPVVSFWGKKKQALLRKVADVIVFREPNKVWKKIAKQYGIKVNKKDNLFDVLVHSSTLMLQSGTQGFEYRRSELGKNIRFIGPLLPAVKNSNRQQWYNRKLAEFDKVVLITQGTVEKDISKLLVPTLEAFRNSNKLVIVTTGGSNTAEIRKKYPDENFIIEDFIPFNEVMPYADVYITNGGYGGVMLAIQNQLPMVVAGVNEGKNEIAARVGYFNLGINLHTENPLPVQIKNSVEKLLTDASYRSHVKQLCNEFSQYNPQQLCAHYVQQLFKEQAFIQKQEIYN